MRIVIRGVSGGWFESMCICILEEDGEVTEFDSARGLLGTLSLLTGKERAHEFG